ncbi:hypothetical protein [Prosthecobacter sp.]|uniref:hypothetical protein n=1 Tax=Prosthecobacter sp. TaxID=1965333 RepID=UPI003784EC8A
MKRPPLFVRSVSVLLCLSVASQAFAERNSLMKLEYGLRIANARVIPPADVLKQMAAGPDGGKARTVLLSYFDRRWISNSQGKLTPALFDQAAGPFDVFGAGYKDLPKHLTASGGLPSAAQDGDFLSYLRRRLPANSVRDELLPKLGQESAGSPGVIANMRFLEDLARDGEMSAVTTHFEKNYWDVCSPSDAAVYQPLLAQGHRASWRGIRTRVGLHVFGLEVESWPGAGKTLLALAPDSGKGIPAFLRKAAGELRAKQALRSGATGRLLEMLAVACDASTAAEALGLTAANCDVEWFVWCHQQSGIINHLLGSADAARALTTRIIAFCQPDDDEVFSRLFSMVQGQYYDRNNFPRSLQDKLFDDLLKPKAVRGEKGGGLVLAAALNGGWRADHRHELALHVFTHGEPDSPAWKSASTTRLVFSDSVYRHLLDGVSPPAVKAHVERPLLGHLLMEYLRRFKAASDNETAMDKAEAEFRPLLDHLGDCRRQGADLSRNASLRQFKSALAEATLEVLDTLQPGSSNTEPVQRFVRRFKMALRVDRLVQPLSGPAGKVPEWVTEVTHGIRRRVFDLPDSHTGQSVQQPKGAILRWDEGALSFRTGVLKDIVMDRDFRQVLANSPLEEHVFEELLLPLARVHGVLRLLCPGAQESAWPHADWSKGQPRRLAQLFKVLDTAESLDCHEAVCSLARITHPQIWRTKPGEIFTGVWSINADLRVLRWLLEQQQPTTADTRPAASDIQGLTQLIWSHWPEAAASPEIWEQATWVEHLLTAGEWQSHPFKIDGKATDWDGPVLPLQGRKPSLPFRFVPTKAQHASTRTVDGQFRLVLVSRLIKLLGSDAEPALLEFVCNATVLLPNSKINDAGGGEGRSYDAPKLEMLQMIHQRLQSQPAIETAVHLVRCYLRLGASLSLPAGARDNPRGGLPETLPTPVELVARVFAPHPQRAMERGSLLEELRRLLLSRERRNESSRMEMLREQLDAALGNAKADGSLLPAAWTGGDRDIIARDYGDRLKQVGENTVRDFLRVRSDLIDLIKADPDGLNAADALRVQRFFGWVDWLLFFSRSDWKTGNGYLDLHSAGSKGGDWWPALALLCAGTPQVQDVCLKGDMMKNRPLMLDLFRLNEAALGTLAAIMAEKDAARRNQMLNFEHELFWTELNLGILARTEHHDTADARTLSENAFHGAVRNIAIATRLQKEPDDKVVTDRLFVTLDSSLRSDRRGEPVISLDGAVRLAAACAEDQGLPAQLQEKMRDAANAMKTAAAGFHEAGLLGGAATPGKVMDLLFHLHEAALQEKSAFWRGFYEKALTVPGAKSQSFILAPSFRKALAQPFFRQSLEGQRTGIDSVVERWRGVASTALPENGCALTSACRGGWGQAIDDLLNGEGREDAKAPFLWQVVNEFEKNHSDMLKKPPQEFLTLSAWLMRFWRDDDPQELKDYFNPTMEVAQP